MSDRDFCLKAVETKINPNTTYLQFYSVERDTCPPVKNVVRSEIVSNVLLTQNDNQPGILDYKEISYTEL